jgi:poly [ADP-ribose] polymerase 7/11/12/13
MFSIGTLYGFGVYFSTNAVYSHVYAIPNANGERCMFIARVLIGKTTLGDSSMKTRPLGFDSTTDNNHIFVTYHDAQAFAEYLITYK